METTGWFDKKYNNVESYFRLKAENKRLADENNKLRNMLAGNFSGPDTTKTFFIDSLIRDTTGKMRKFIWLPAKVINNSISSQTNYITLERGANQGVRKGMAVVAPGNSIVGTVAAVSDNYSIVMSLLHRNSQVSSMLKKDRNAGKLEWDGKDPLELTLKNIPRSAKVAKGDTVLTSTYSANYPPGLMVGKIIGIDADPSSNFFTLKIRPLTNFSAIQYVYLVDNLLYAEQKDLEEQIKQSNQ
jgi:rod shape-determining protein MreC